MLVPIIGIGIFLMVLERIIPDQPLPSSKDWWQRVVIINGFQLGVIFLGKLTWDQWFLGWSLFHLGELHPALGGFLGYLAVTFVFYWWHRWRHDCNFLWLAFHQIHHSPRRIETITSFYKHPLEIVINSIIIGLVNYTLLGLSLEAAAWCLLYSAMGEFFYNMNIKTPHWIGYFFQRPEMHRIHHQRGKHYQNFSDIPLWDMCFGTFSNPVTYRGLCGFKPKSEARFWAMLATKNVNHPYRKEQGHG